MLSSLLLSISSVAVIGVGAARPYDHSEPCFHGVCSFDIPQSHDSIGGTLVITGTSYAISDISPSSGWEILDCSYEEDRTDMLRVHLACTGDPAGCAHLYERGAEHTLVRLPDDCGELPFARVASATAFDNQSLLDLPPRVLDALDRRGINHDKVRTLSLGTDYAGASHSKHGTISFAIVGSTVPGFSASKYMGTTVFTRQRGKSRNLARDINDALEEMLLINEDKSWAIPALSFDRSFSIFNESVPCAGREDAVVNVGVHAKADVNITLGLAAVGTFFPPRVTRVSVYAGMTADLNSELDIFATAIGSLDTGAIGIFSADLPTLGVKGILSVAPTFDVSVSTHATVDTALDARLGASYSLGTLRLVVPSQEGASSAAVAPTTSHLQLSMRPGAASNASLEAHLVPSLGINVAAFGGNIASADLAVDTSVRLAFDLEDAFMSDEAAPPSPPAGCINLSGAVSASASAHGLWNNDTDSETRIDIFSEEFKLLQRCFAEEGNTGPSSVLVRQTAGNRPRSVAPFLIPVPALALLSCPDAPPEAGESLVLDVDMLMNDSITGLQASLY